jgi:hypothetical protein
LLAIHTQEALYSKEATDLLMRSYVNVLKEVVKQGGEKTKVEKLEKWDMTDVKTALELGKGMSTSRPHRYDVRQWATAVAGQNLEPRK